MAEERHEILPPPPADRRTLIREPPNAEAAEGAFDHLVTPASMRFVRCHFEIPRLGDEHQLELTGALAHPLLEATCSRCSIRCQISLPVSPWKPR